MVARFLRVGAWLTMAITMSLMASPAAAGTSRRERVRKAITALMQPSNVWVSHIWFVPSDVHDRATKELARIGPEAVGPLLELLRAEGPEHRALAARALGKIRDPRIVPVLIDTFENDEFWGVREEAADALAQARDSRAIEPLLHSIQEKPTRYAVSALSRFPTAMVVKTLADLLSLTYLRRTQRIDIGEYAGYSLGKMGTLGHGALLHAVHDERPEVRLGAGFGLVYVQERRTVAAAVELLDDPHPYVRETIAFRLGLKRRREAVPSLIRQLDDPEMDVRRSAAIALGNIGDPRAASALVQALQGADVAVAMEAAEALGKVRGRDGVGPLIAAMQRKSDPSVEVINWRAAAALGKIGDRRAALPLLEVARDTHRDFFTRSSAIRALGDLRYRPALPDVVAVLQHGDPGMRAVACEALGKIGDRNSGALLIERLSDTGFIQDEAAVSLGQLRYQPAVEPLRQMMIRNSRDYQRKIKARDAIIRITGRAPKFAPGELN